jgi:uridine phosphorylase
VANNRPMNDLSRRPLPPILAGKDVTAASVFRPENLLREARRQKGLPELDIPEICILDPDGDILRDLRACGRARRSPGWACYHTDLFEFTQGSERFGIIGCAVGGSFAVLLAEELFVSGCRFLVSMTSAGQIEAHGPTPYFVLIERALRDEGTSYHYLPPAEFAAADPALVESAFDALAGSAEPVYRGAAWTTDAPFRETEAAIERARARGILAVEMEAAALYAFAKARGKPVLCFAHVTNQMAITPGDFEKGEADGAKASLAVIAAAAAAWRRLAGVKK